MSVKASGRGPGFNLLATMSIVGQQEAMHSALRGGCGSFWHADRDDELVEQRADRCILSRCAKRIWE